MLKVGILPVMAVLISVAPCENIITKRDIIAEVLGDAEKTKYTKIILRGPPPIPKKLETIPSVQPMRIIKAGFLKLYVLQSLKKILFIKIISVIIKMQIAAISPTILSFLRVEIKISKMPFPIIPPITAPMARKILTLRFLRSIFLSQRIIEKVARVKEAQQDKKVITGTDKVVKASKDGFIIIPPPMPLIAPIVQAIMVITEYKT